VPGSFLVTICSSGSAVSVRASAGGKTGTVTELQTEANIGAIGLIVARRVDDGRPGHIAVVIPETSDANAKRDASGEVIAPLQSQAGATNFTRSTGRLNWWTQPVFADNGFWLHA
jgi:hypothetical protein